MMAALLTACGHRVSQSTAADADSIGIDCVITESDIPVPFVTDSIGMEYNDSMANVHVSVDWPVEGPEPLVANLRQYIAGQFTKKKDISNGKTLVKEIAAEQYKELKDMWIDSQEYGNSMTFSFWFSCDKEYETDTYVTYGCHQEGFTGGAHGYAISYSATFSKATGHQMGYTSVYDEKNNKYHIKDQTLFRNANDPQLQKLIKEGVKEYFSEMDEKKISDEELADMLQGVDDINHLPLPNNAPGFIKDGLSFIYQQYEITCYALGMPNFVIPYDKIRPFLTDEAAALIPRKQ